MQKYLKEICFVCLLLALLLVFSGCSSEKAESQRTNYTDIQQCEIRLCNRRYFRNGANAPLGGERNRLCVLLL